MTDLIAEAVRLEGFMQSRAWRHCFIGGLAVQHWGEPRLTRDLDLSLLTGFGDEASYVDALLSVYAARMEGARDFALTRRVLLLRSAGGIGIDISLAAIPYEEIVVSRSVPIEMLPGAVVRLCAPEDLIVMKMFAGRDTDLRDVRSILVRQSERNLDWRHIDTHLAELAEANDDATAVQRLHRLWDDASRL
jgi:hypothetical protein